ncbi:MAG TPA: hypothetical protein DEG28_00830, partial [Porphyromonadaceae bacterium]|nr:hypothetical protein [Porphyromonadaceae bacterium]
YINTTLLTLAKPYPVLYIWLNTEFLVRFCLNLFLLFSKLHLLPETMESWQSFFGSRKMGPFGE